MRAILPATTDNAVLILGTIPAGAGTTWRLPFAMTEDCDFLELLA
ncbi:hypothetical protein AB5J72_50270 [Streptomyces sp. CG1]